MTEDTAVPSPAEHQGCAESLSPLQEGQPSTQREHGEGESPTSNNSIPSVPNTQRPMTVMGPPAAPASMFWTFEEGPRGKTADQRMNNDYIACRLVAVVVILFRAGNIKYANIIGQFAVDILGKDKWCECLPPYLSSKPQDGDNEAVYGLLDETRKALKIVDSESAAYLEGVMATMKED